MDKNNYKISSPSSSILLLIPSWGNDRHFYSTPHLGLGYAASALMKHHHQVKVLDLSFYKKDLNILYRMIKDHQPEVVGITGFTFQYTVALEIIKFIKKNFPALITVLGGPHANAVADILLEQEQDIDFILRGETEESFPQFIQALFQGKDFDKVPGLVFRKEGAIVSSPPRYISNLDNLEYPWKAVNPLDYQKGRVHGFICKRLPVTQVISSRGCPYLCTFCAGQTVHGKKIRMRDPVKFVDELEFLKKQFGIREVQIVDDNFTFYRDHAMAVCREMIRRRLNLTWSLPNGVRADRLDEELLLLMKKAGCYYFAFGIEFGSPRILKLVKKSLDLDQARSSIRLANKLHFITQGFFLMGHPEETEKDIELTGQFITSVPLDKIIINLPFPYPGSELFDFYIKNRYKDIKNIDWNYFKELDFKRIFQYLNNTVVLKKRRKILLLFYLNPFNMLRFLFKFRTWVQWKSAFYGLLVLLEFFRKER
ncbi:MAG: radical SAM protein [bacterium]|nr:radical SAM protein [bacterium]